MHFIFLRWPFLLFVIAVNSIAIAAYIYLLYDFYYFFGGDKSRSWETAALLIIGLYWGSVILFASPAFAWLGHFALKTRKPSGRELETLNRILMSIEENRRENRAQQKRGKYPKLFGGFFGISPNQIRFRVIDFNNINAFAYGDGYVAISRALFDMLGDDELEAVIAHELAHLIYRDTHYAALFENATIPFRRVIILLGSLPVFISGVVILPVMPLLFFFIHAQKVISPFRAFFSRNEEYRADRYSAWITGGIPNRSFFDYTREFYDVEGLSVFDTFIASHPPIELRRDRVAKFEAKMSDVPET